MQALRQPSRQGQPVGRYQDPNTAAQGPDHQAFAPPPGWSGNRSADVSRDTYAEAGARRDMMGFGSPQSGYGPGGVQNPAYGGPAAQGAPQGAPQASQGQPGGAHARWGTADIPEAADLTWGDTSRMTGFNTNAWGTPERGSNTIKNSFGKIASRYDPRQPGAARQMMADPDFQRLFPEARLVEHPKGDQIDFGDGNPIDVLVNAVEGGAGEAWAFQTGGGMEGAPMGAPGSPQGQATNGYQFDPQAQLLLQALQGGNQDNFNVSIDEILATLGMNNTPQV